MAFEDIILKDQWDVVRTMEELLKLEEHVKDFLSHTMKTMSTPIQHGPFGWMHDDDDDNGVVHPMGGFLGVISSCKDGCFKRYGEDMFKQGVLFDKQFRVDDE